MATTNFNIGDVEKQMDDLSAFSGKAIANNLTTSTEGYVLDARQGKELNDHIATLSNKFKYETRTISATLTQGAGYNIDITNVPSGYVPVAITNVSLNFTYTAVLIAPRFMSNSWKVSSWSSQGSNAVSGDIGILFVKS